MPNPEELSAFEAQIDRSLDHQIEQLRALDRKKAKTLKALKGEILAQIKGDGSESYTDDLRLTEEELESVFGEVQKKYPELLAKQDIESFWQFKEFIGMTDAFEVSYTHRLSDGAELFGRKVDIVLPLGVSELQVQNYQIALLRIGERSDLEPYFDSVKQITPLGGARLEFVIERDGENVKYCANFDGVFRVDEESSVSKRKEWVEVTLNIKRQEKRFHLSLEEDSSIDDSHKRFIEMSLYGGESKMISGMMGSEMSDSESFQVPSKYQKMIDQIQQLRDREGVLRQECSVRMLFDEKTGMRIREEGNPRHLGGFSMDHLTEDGVVERRMEYYMDEKVREVEFSVEDGHKKTETDFFRQEEESVVQAWAYDRNGMLVSCPPLRARKVNHFSEDGESVEALEYRGDGTLESRTVGRNEDVYDESGEQVLYRRIWPEGVGRVQNAMLDDQGEPFATLDYAQEQNPEMTGDQYLDFLAEQLDTPEKLHLFIELFMQYVHDDPNLTDATYLTPNVGGPTDYWQTAFQTVERVREGKMLGDCDDYAFLAKDILRRQGKVAHVITIPGHAICVWFEQREDGNWDAYSMGTFGLDKNGNRYGMEVDPEKAKGYSTIYEGLNSLMPKYDKGGLGLAEGRHYRYAEGEEVLVGTTDGLGGKDEIAIPIEMLSDVDPLFVDRTLEIQNLVDAHKYGEAILAYEEMMQDYPAYVDRYHDKIAFTLTFLDYLLAPDDEKKSNDEQKRIALGYIEKYPDRPEYNVLLGRLYAWQDEPDEGAALAQYRIAVEKGSTDDIPYINLADSYKESGDTVEQIKVLELALENCSRLNYRACLDLIQAYDAFGDREKALDAIERSILKEPAYEDVFRSALE